MVRALAQEPPVKFGVVVPFPRLTELSAHEENLFARKKPLIGQQTPEVGEALPIIAGHTADERAFSMNHFVVRKRQHEVLVVMVEHGEGQIVMVPFAMNRLAREVAQRVVHPAHVPLETETKASKPGRS